MASLYRAKIEAKNKGMNYIIDKYGQAFWNRNKMALQRATGRAPGRDKKTLGGQSFKNKPPEASGHYVYEGGSALYADGGEAAPTPTEPEYGQNMQLNLENDKALGQGYQTPWAQTTSISHLITSMLKESQTAPTNYFNTVSQNGGGTMNLTQRPSSSFGYDVAYNPPQQEQSMNAYGSFGTQQIMQEEDEGTADPADPATTGVTDIDYTPGTATPPDMGGPSNDYYNPWSFGQGGNTNSYGPSQQSLSQATMEAMQLANNYFAPQRLELAYELGDMETDMRRLAVNLGRQVDDPTLQAKLYKEAMRAVRVLDVQQNTMALQMADQRRREEIQNFQYYDALGQEEWKLSLANRQFYEDLGLRSAYFDLQNSIGMNQPYSSTTNTTGTPQAPAAGQQQQESLQGIYKSMLNYNSPYNQGGNLLR
jgi:hypothetical protein